MNNGLCIPGFEDYVTTTPLPLAKKEINKRKEFKFCKEELFHSDLYGPMPKAFSTPLPELAPYKGDLPVRLLPFNVAYSTGNFNCTVHFFIDDLLFIRVLRNPEKYLDFFKKCHSVIGTDLSQYSDMSAEDRYYSAYINRAISAYFQQNGVRLIPNVTWSLPDSYYYSWSSMPSHSVIAINCKGIMQHDASIYLWKKGYTAACMTLCPSHIVRYGSIMPDENTAISLYFENERLNHMRYGR